MTGSNCDNSVKRIAKLEEAKECLEISAAEMKMGSEGITQGTVEVARTFEDVQEKMQTTEKHIDFLNLEVKK